MLILDLIMISGSIAILKNRLNGGSGGNTEAPGNVMNSEF